MEGYEDKSIDSFVKIITNNHILWVKKCRGVSPFLNITEWNNNPVIGLKINIENQDSKTIRLFAMTPLLEFQIILTEPFSNIEPNYIIDEKIYSINSHNN